MTAATAQHHAPSKSIHTLLVGALTAAAFALRLVRLGVDSLWYDETVSVYLAGQRVPDLIAHTARDIHPPGYYLLLRGWLALTGFPTGRADPAGYRLEFAAAFLSLLFGVLLVPLTWQLARRLRLGDTTATVAALLVTVSPFGVWYSQEVRMYTLGATLGLLCLLTAAPFLFGDAATGRLWRAAAIFAVAAAAGLYTLYYFAFLLISINLLVLPLLSWRWRTIGRDGSPGLAIWLVAQLGALLLFAPWLPTAWRQATDPPVPPWRAAPQPGASLAESWGALSFGQSADIAQFWPLLALTLGLVALGAVAAWRGLPGAPAQPRDGADRRAPAARFSLALLLVAVFGPLTLILLASALTPLYHVRYLFTYAPAFSILLALGIGALLRWRRPLGSALAVAAVILILAGSVLSLHAFWTDPARHPDDHRAAVRGLADRWRPGDAILVNAGYAYPPLLTYWSGPPIGWLGRLTDFDRNVVERAGGLPVVVQTGHVGGDPDLGWGDARSDFFALPEDVMQSKLAELSIASDRVWHYRIYDTVNDPAGDVRAALANSGTLVDDQVFPGEANLRTQLWQGMRSFVSSFAPPPLATFDGWLTLGLSPEALPEQLTAGESLDIADVRWTRPPELVGHAQAVAISLRLVDETGEVWAARDERLGGNQLDMAGANMLVQPLHLPVPVGTPPITYDLVLVVYDPLTGKPLTEASDDATSLVLGQVIVLPSSQPYNSRPLADFGPLQLLEADSPASLVSPGDAIPVELLWQAGQDATPEPLVIVVQLVDEQGNVIASLEEEPLQGRYPTTVWRVDEVVRDRRQLRVPDSAPAGTYQLIVGVYRASDRERLQVQTSPLSLRSSDHALIKSIEIR